MKTTRGVKISIGLGILILLTYITYTVLSRQTQKQNSDIQTREPTITPPHSSVEQAGGNNATAKIYAQQLKSTADRVYPGVVQQVNLQFTPDNVTTTNKGSISLVKASIQVTKANWDDLTENQRQNLLTLFSDTLRFSKNTAEAFMVSDTTGEIIATGHQ